VMAFGGWVAGGAKNLIGGGGEASTTVGTAVAGGITNTFHMTFDVSGMTDMTDKRRLAREIGNMIQEELGRGIHTGSRRTY